MIRNEILEVGQLVLLYNNGEWKGKSRGLGTLIQCDARNAFEERWVITLDRGEKLHWSMLRTDKELVVDNSPPPFYLSAQDDDIPF